MNALQLTAQVVFWLTLGLVFVSYFGVSIILTLATCGRKPRDIPSDAPLPRLSILIPAYNEARVIGEKLRNMLAQDYPSELRDIVVISDQSTDATDETVKSFEGAGVKLIRTEKRLGKFGILDAYVSQMQNEIVVIIDANMMLASGALRNLARYFADSEVGLAGGNTIFKLSISDDRPPKGELIYHNFETYSKTLMNRLGAVVSVYGGFYAFRKALFRPIGRKPVHDDVMLPIEVLAAGYRTHFTENAVATEIIASARKEFKRHIRLSAYSLNSLTRALKISAKAGPKIFIIVFVNKVLRWLSPYLLGLMCLALIPLLKLGLVYPFIAGIIAFGIAGAALGGLAYLFGFHIFIISAMFYFAFINFAAYIGLFRWLGGIKPYWTQQRKG